MADRNSPALNAKISEWIASAATHEDLDQYARDVAEMIENDRISPEMLELFRSLGRQRREELNV